jgi:hypothetical protein
LDKWIIDLKEKTKMLIIDSISKLINELPLDTPASLSREIDSFCRAKMITFGHDYERNIRQMVDALRNDLRPHIDKRVSDLKVRENDLILRKMINEFIQDLIKKTPILSENDNDEAHYSSNNVIIALLDTMMPTLPRGFISEDVSCFQDTIKQQSKVGREPDMQAKVQTLVENVSQSTQQDVTQVKSEIINYLLYKLSDNSVNLYNAFSKFKDHAKLLEHIQKSLRGERYLTKRLEKRGFNKEQRRAAILSTARQLGIAPDEYMNRVRSRKKIQVALKEKIVSILEVAYTQADPALRTKLGDKESFTTNFLDKSKFSMNFADMDLGAESFYIFLNSCWAIELQYTKQNNLRVMFKKNDESILNENDKCIGEVKIAQTKQEIKAWTNLMNSIRRNMQDVIGLVLRLSLGEIVGIIEKAGQKDNAKTMANWVESWLETKDFKAARPRGLIVDFNSRSNRFQLTDDFKEFTVGINDDKTLESITIRCSDLPLCGFGYPDSCTIIIPNSTQDGKQTKIVLTEGIKAERILAILRWLLCFTASEEA